MSNRLLRVIRTISITFSFSLTAFNTFAAEPYIKTAELICGDVRVIVTTKCADDSYPAYPDCQKQQFVFSNLKTGHTQKLDANGRLIKSKSSTATSVLDGLASNWTCVNGKKATYIVSGYYNGGNCEECEWYEIYSLQGLNLTLNARKNKTLFDKTLSRLGVARDWSKKLIDIPLTR